MNCERVNFILDSKSATQLTAAERQVVEQHLASCDECREAWKAYRELAALRIPATPQHLRVRIATALATRAIERLHARRGFFVGLVLLAGAAVATTTVLRLTNRSHDPAPDPAPAIEEVAPVVQPVAPPEPESAVLTDERVPNSPAPAEPSAPANTATYPIDPYRVVVVAVPEPGADAEATDRLAVCSDDFVEEVQRGPSLNIGLHIIVIEQPRTLIDSPWPEFRVARELGVGSGLRVSLTREGCRATWFNLQTGEVQDVSGPGGSLQLIAQAARTARDYVSMPKAMTDEAGRRRVINAGLNDSARAAELVQLRLDPAPTPFDMATVMAAVRIASTSGEENIRARAWFALRGVTNPYIVQSALHALEIDAGERVRTHAALALAPFADRPAVRGALTRAAAETPSARPICCFFTVRSAARLALRGAEDPAGAVRKSVLDEELTPQERLVLTRPVGIDVLPLHQLGDEAAFAVFEMGWSSDDPGVRSAAWLLLGDVSETSFTQALRDDLERHPDEFVRAAAAFALRQHRDDPDVRLALYRTLLDASWLVQRAAQSTLDGSGVRTEFPRE